MLVARSRKTAAPADTEPADTGPASDLRVRELCSTTVLISAAGEIDACNADDVAVRIEAAIAGHRQLVLDLTAVRFCGTVGYAMLRRLDIHCRRRRIDWVLLPGSEVRRLLRICDPDGVIPTAENVVAGVAWLTRAEFHGA